MARFQAGGSTGEGSSTLPGRAKPALQPTLSSGHSVPAKKPVLETLSGGPTNIPPKPTLKNNDAPEPNRTKPLVSKFSNTGGGDKPSMSVPKAPQKPPPPEAKAPGPKPLTSKPLLSTTQSDSKPSPGVVPKPSWVKEDAGEGEADATPPRVAVLQQKPASSIQRLRQHSVTAASNSKPVLAGSAPRSASNFKEAQSLFGKEAEADGGGKANATPPPKPISKKPSLKKPSPQPGAANTPRKNPLINTLVLGPAPAKPNRPPAVNLEPFRRGPEASGDGESPQTCFPQEYFQTCEHVTTSWLCGRHWQHPVTRRQEASPPPPFGVEAH